MLYRSPDIDQGIRDVLAAVGQTLDVSRGYIFEESPDGSFVTNTYEWCGRGITSKMDDFADYPYEQFGGRIIIYVCLMKTVFSYVRMWISCRSITAGCLAMEKSKPFSSARF